MMVHGNAALAPMRQPCECISFDCATQLGCICSPALPSPFTALASSVAWELLSYWPRLAAAPAGLSIKPNLRPPYSCVINGRAAEARSLSMTIQHPGTFAAARSV
jgi:hypothetical protein